MSEKVNEKYKLPTNLRAETQKWVEDVLAEYEIEPHHFRLLCLAAQAFDRVSQAREILRKEGLTYLDRFKQPHARPEVNVERDSAIVFSRLVRELRLDIEPSDDPRPPRIGE